MPPDSPYPLNICLLTDVFPPHSGGSGWSTYYLGKALSERGHNVRVLRPVYVQSVSRPSKRAASYGGLQVEELLVPEAPAWARRAGMGKAWSDLAGRTLLARRAAQLAIRCQADVLHGQHSLSATAAAIAARHARSQGADVVSLGTIRDYWPLCPVSTRLFTDHNSRTFECKQCHHLLPYLGVTKDQSTYAIRNTLPRLPLSLARWLQTWHAGRLLAQCDAVIAVSHYVRAELARSGRIPVNKLTSIPNLVDLPSVDRALTGNWPLRDIPPGQPFLLFVGKWDTNKGPQLLPEAIEMSGIRMPLVLAGEGPLRPELEREAARRDLDFRFVSWIDNDAAILLMRHATALLFPSAWQEPLSRVLLEGCAAGAAIVALRTGGTSDAITHGESGWLANNMPEFAEGLNALESGTQLNARLRSGARHRAESQFAAPVVSASVEALYRRLLQRMRV